MGTFSQIAADHDEYVSLHPTHNLQDRANAVLNFRDGLRRQCTPRAELERLTEAYFARLERELAEVRLCMSDDNAF